MSVISKAIAIHNANLKGAFEITRAAMSGNHDSVGHLFKKTTWKQVHKWAEGHSRSVEDREQRFKFMDFLQTYINQFDDKKKKKKKKKRKKERKKEKNKKNIFLPEFFSSLLHSSV